MWQRWSWQYRVGALLGLALLLQGASCPIELMVPAFKVPGVNGEVVPRKYMSLNNRPYYLLDTPPLGDGIHTAVYDDNPDYALIEAYFRKHPEIGVVGFDRSAIPGGTGAPPKPPGM